MVYAMSWENKGKRKTTIGPERVYGIEVSNPENRTRVRVEMVFGPLLCNGRQRVGAF